MNKGHDRIVIPGRWGYSVTLGERGATKQGCRNARRASMHAGFLYSQQKKGGNKSKLPLVTLPGTKSTQERENPRFKLFSRVASLKPHRSTPGYCWGLVDCLSSGARPGWWISTRGWSSSHSVRQRLDETQSTTKPYSSSPS